MVFNGGGDEDIYIRLYPTRFRRQGNTKTPSHPFLVTNSLIVNPSPPCLLISHNHQSYNLVPRRINNDGRYDDPSFVQVSLASPFLGLSFLLSLYIPFSSPNPVIYETHQPNADLSLMTALPSPLRLQDPSVAAPELALVRSHSLAPPQASIDDRLMLCMWAFGFLSLSCRVCSHTRRALSSSRLPAKRLIK